MPKQGYRKRREGAAKKKPGSSKRTAPVGAVAPEESWLTLAMKTFSPMRSMTAEEVAAYRAFKRKISRRIGKIEMG